MNILERIIWHLYVIQLWPFTVSNWAIFSMAMHYIVTVNYVLSIKKSRFGGSGQWCTGERCACTRERPVVLCGAGFCGRLWVCRHVCVITYVVYETH